MRGEHRRPTAVWLLVPLTCHVYGYYWWYTAGCELKDYLGDEDLDPALDLVLALATCGLYAFFVLPYKYGRLIQRAQKRAGVESVRYRGAWFVAAMFLAYYSYAWMQKELNRVWEADAGAPAVSRPVVANEMMAPIGAEKG